MLPINNRGVPLLGDADEDPSSTHPIPNDTASGVVGHFGPSSMAVTTLVLLLALFFLGFFSIFARRCFTRSNNRGRRPSSLLLTGLYRSVGPFISISGLDPTAISALPVLSYTSGGGRSSAGCVVCLCEFEEKERVKVIPACGHVFHPTCIDAWLVSRGTCPVCRCCELFDGTRRCGGDVCLSLFSGGGGDEVVEEEEEGRVVVGLRRSRSWCVRREGGDSRGMLQRTCSA